jgi:hypothetical protein
MDELKLFVNELSPHVICFSETWFNNTVLNKHIMNSFECYQLFRRDRHSINCVDFNKTIEFSGCESALNCNCNGRGGGLLIMIKKFDNCVYEEYKTNSKEDKTEFLSIKLS